MVLRRAKKTGSPHTPALSGLFFFFKLVRLDCFTPLRAPTTGRLRPRASCGFVFLVAVVVRAVVLRRAVLLRAVLLLSGLPASGLDGQDQHHQETQEV